jgi:hypothetical protein
MKWKSKILLSLTIVLFINLTNSFCQIQSLEKIHADNNEFDGSVHALGNGKMLVYERGADIIDIYPGPYSTPSILKMDMIESTDVVTTSTREQGTAIWTHQLFQNGKSVGSVIDFIDSEMPCMIRHFKLTGTMSFNLKIKDYAEVIQRSKPEDATGRKESLLLVVPAGTIFYQKYAYPRPLYHQIFWQGNAVVEKVGNKKNEYIITINRGESDIYFSGGPEYPQCILNSEEIQKLSFEKSLARTKNWWKFFTASRTNFDSLLPANLPLRQKLLRTIDDVSVMIKTQQSREGSVIAGYPYPLGYVRDQYGVSRGLLALGYTAEAKQILDFYWNIWRKYGEIHNAQGIDIDGVFHIHENDEVEIPGYLIVQAFDYHEKSGDDKFLRSIFPMLEWCWNVQKKHLAKGMLPFNGDETYVAGGFLPRSALNDGSSEATMLFIDGGEKLLGWIKTHKEWSAEKLGNERLVLDKTRNQFRENFWINGQLITNNPDRLDFADIPRFRHGVCERSGPDCIVSNPKGFSGIDWTERDKNNRYQCPACLALGPLPKAIPHSYNLVSVSLIPLYMHSSLFRAEELRPLVEKVYSRYEKTGILSCIFDSTGTEKNRRTVGYDYGFLLYSMLETGMEKSEIIYKKTLSVADSTGVWSEYYNDHIPQGTRYRPWESAINIEALIEFATKYK